MYYYHFHNLGLLVFFTIIYLDIVRVKPTCKRFKKIVIKKLQKQFASLTLIHYATE